MPLEPVSRISNGEEVSAEITNRPLDSIDQRLNYLYDLVRASGAQTSLIKFDEVVGSACLLGGPVYYDEDTQQFEPAQAGVQITSDGVIPSAASRHWGILLRRIGVDRGDVLIGGYAIIDVTDVIETSFESGPSSIETAPPGTLYLSATTPGKYNRSPAFPSIAVCEWDGVGVLVRPFRDDEFAGRHEHFSFDLLCRPAGTVTPPDPGERHTIGLVASVPGQPGDPIDHWPQGWLPADSSYFNGVEPPPGAVFGYNITDDDALSAVWPPLPVSSAVVFLDRGGDKDYGKTMVPMGPTGLVLINEDGIWWMSDCFGDAPWPVTYDSASEPAALSEGYAECPRQLEMQMTLVFTRPTLATGAAVVTSLTPDDERIEITCDGEPAGVGDLRIKLNLEAGVSDEETPTGTALKAVEEDGKFKSGKVVSGLYAASDNVLLNSDDVTEGEGDDPDVYHNAVGISVVPAELLYLPVDLFRMQNAEEDYVREMMLFAWRKDEESHLRGLIYIPPGIGDSLTLKPRVWLMGYAAGTLPALTLVMRRLTRPTGTPLELPTTDDDISVPITTAVPVDAAYKYTEIDSNSFVVAAGETILFDLIRSDGDGYNADLGLLQAKGVLATS